jgi:4-hydroxy-tetrahydrodipicolinate reductase
MSARIDLVLIGAGRMGRAILEIAAADPGVRVMAVVARRPPPAPLPGAAPFFMELTRALESAAGAVVLDFSSAVEAAERIGKTAERGHPLVLGTTGLDAETEEAVTRWAARIPILVAPNTSPGVFLLRRAVEAAGTALALGWDAGIVDRHHRAKQDAPSGTARLLEADLRALGAKQIEVVSLRQGGVVGEHAVYLTGPEEEVVLLHRAFSRRAFATGALLAARFAGSVGPGRYGMEDVLESRG